MVKFKTLFFLFILSFILVNLYGCNTDNNNLDDQDNAELNEEETKSSNQEEEDMNRSNIIFNDSGMDYSESLSNILNPERGFYKPMTASLSNTNPNAIWSADTINADIEQFSLFHLRIGLEAFSTNAGGSDSYLSDTAIESLTKTLEEFRKTNTSIIIRFSYNKSGTTDSEGNYLNAEPTMNLIEAHIKQLGEVLSNYYDVIASVETGMFGPWGEQHSTILGDSSIRNSFNYFKLVETWLKVLPEGCSVTVRRPLYYIYWANAKYGLGLTTENISSFNALDYPDFKDLTRVGVYNDGYLGSSSDLGTYINRDSELEWLSKQAKFALFGGEVVADSITSGLGEFNSVDFLEDEAFITRTSYLNYFWNYKMVISEWEKNLYNGNKELYNNQVSEYTFVANHLGYRLVLRNSLLSNNELNKNKIFLKGNIENVGFGNIVNKKKTEIILLNETNKLYFEVDLDVRDILSNQISDYFFEIDLPNNVNVGNYDVFLKISDAQEKETSKYRTIRFANQESYWNDELGANYLGSISIE